MSLQLDTTPLIVALDFSSKNDVLALVNKLDPKQCQLKIGKAMFTRYGPSLVRELMQLGFKIFLDLKFHDIPHQVAGAAKAVADLGVWMFNVHAMGGLTMLQAAKDAISSYGSERPLLIAVTVLTSANPSELKQLGLSDDTQTLVTNLASISHQAGLDGVVCSSQEAMVLRNEFTQSFILVTPGIRFADDAGHDQRRIMSPKDALAAGSDYLVVGRSITEALEPMAVVKKIQQAWN